MNLDSTLAVLAAATALVEAIRRLILSAKSRQRRTGSRTLPRDIATEKEGKAHSFWPIVVIVALLAFSFFARSDIVRKVPLAGRSVPVLSLSQQSPSSDVGGYPMVSINHTLTYERAVGVIGGKFDGSMAGNAGLYTITGGTYIIQEGLGSKWDEMTIEPVDEKLNTINKAVGLSLQTSVKADEPRNTYIAHWIFGRVQNPSVSIEYKQNVQVILTRRRVWIFERIYEYLSGQK